MNINAREFVDKFDVGYERKRGGKSNAKIFGPSN